MHPLTGQRLDLWRLKNFVGTREPAAEGTYLFHLMAPDNSQDERLVSLAEVRDLTPLRDHRRHGGRLPGRRAGTGRLPGEHPQGAGATNEQATPGQQPGVPARLADGRASAVRTRRVRPAQHGGDVRHRTCRDHRAGRTSGGRRIAARCRDPVHLPGRRRTECHGHRPADRCAGTAGRIHPEGAARQRPWHDLPVRDRATADRTTRIVHRVRLARRRHVQPGRPAGRQQHCRCRGRHHHDTDHHISGRHHPGRPVRRSDESPRHGCGHRMCHRRGGDRPGAGVGCAGRVVHAVLRRHHLHGQRHREHGRGSPGTAPHHHLHPGRR